MNNKNTHFEAHKAHRLTNRFCAPWCDTCALPIFHSSDWCTDCYGQGSRKRMANNQHGYGGGKRYNCGTCKGTGVCKPIACHYCGELGEIVITAVAWGTRPLPTCSGCYVGVVEQATQNEPYNQVLGPLLAKLEKMAQ